MDDQVNTLSRKVIVLLITTSVCVCLVLLTAYTKFIYANDYQFRIEAPCDPETESCFVRDCEEYCPPNGLEVFSVFEISAADYEKCTTNSCENVCQSVVGDELCLQVSCDEENGDDCTD